MRRQICEHPCFYPRARLYVSIPLERLLEQIVQSVFIFNLYLYLDLVIPCCTSKALSLLLKICLARNNLERTEASLVSSTLATSLGSNSPTVDKVIAPLSGSGKALINDSRILAISALAADSSVDCPPTRKCEIASPTSFSPNPPAGRFFSCPTATRQAIRAIHIFGSSMPWSFRR
jgi:hypothetical protein